MQSVINDDDGRLSDYAWYFGDEGSILVLVLAQHDDGMVEVAPVGNDGTVTGYMAVSDKSLVYIM